MAKQAKAPQALHIHGLEIENFKRVRSISLVIPAKGGMFEIVGANGQGKSSTIDAIWSAIGGKSVNPAEPIRRGQKRGHVQVDLGDLIVRREWWPTGTKLFVTEPDGFPPKEPQALLDRLFNKLAFDPLAFVHLKAAERGRILREITGLDFTATDAERARLFAERTDVNRAVKSQEARVAEMPNPPATEEVSTSQLGAKLQNIFRKNSNREHLSNKLQISSNNLAQTTREITELERRLDSLKELLGKQQQENDLLVKELRETNQEDPEPIQRQLADAETINRRAREYRERQAAAEELRANRAHAEDLTLEIERIDAERKRLVATTTMPVDGLSIDPADPDTILFRDVPFDQVSTSEQIRVALAIAARLNPTLRMVVIREGSLLDESSLRLVAEWAEANGYQVIVERVAASVAGAAGVVIEDGAVASVTNNDDSGEGPTATTAGKATQRGDKAKGAALPSPLGSLPDNPASASEWGDL